MAKEAKSAMLMYYEWRHAFDGLPPDLKLRLYETAMDYAETGNEPDLSDDPVAQSFFRLMRAQIDRDSCRYAAQAENGKKGGRPRKPAGSEYETRLNQTEAKCENKNPEKPNETQTNPTKPNSKNRNLDVDADVDADVDGDVDADVDGDTGGSGDRSAPDGATSLTDTATSYGQGPNDTTGGPQPALPAGETTRPKRQRAAPFIPPTPEEVTTYAADQGRPEFDANAFVDFYTAKNWMIGRNKMRDWRAAVRNWMRRDQADAHRLPATTANGRIPNDNRTDWDAIAAQYERADEPGRSRDA